MSESRGSTWFFRGKDRLKGLKVANMRGVATASQLELPLGFDRCIALSLPPLLAALRTSLTAWPLQYEFLALLCLCSSSSA